MALTTAETNAANSLLDTGLGISVVSVVIAIARATGGNPTTIATQYKAAYADTFKLLEASGSTNAYDFTKPTAAG